MTKQEKYDLAAWTIDHALRQGSGQVSVSISNSCSNDIEVRNEKPDKLEQAVQNSLTVRLFVDNKYSVHSTNRLKKEELARFIDQAVAGTRYLSEDIYRSLPEPHLYYKGNNKDLHTVDNDYYDLDPKQKLDLAFQVEKEVLGKDDRIISVSASYYDSLSERVLVTSNGFKGDTTNSHYGLNASVSVDGGSSRPESYWSESAVFFSDLKKRGAGTKALTRALKKIGQQKISSGSMPMIVENRQLSRLFSPLIAALNGSAIQQKNSFLVNKLDEKTFSEKLSVTDDPFIISGRGSRLFDNEGLASKKRMIIENGVLKNYYIDTYYGKKLEMEPTTGISSNLVFGTGDKDLASIISGLERGILVTAFNGGNCNGSTGDFSYGIEGFLIEKGTPAMPISEMNITGNMLQLWSGTREIGNDINYNSSWLTPSVLFEAVDFSGM